MDQDEFILMMKELSTGNSQSQRAVHEFFRQFSEDENFKNFLVSFLLDENPNPNLKNLCLSVMRTENVNLNQDQIQALLQLFQFHHEQLSYFLSLYLGSFLYDLSDMEYYIQMFDDYPNESILCIAKAINTISKIKRDSAEKMTFDDIGGENMVAFLYNAILNCENPKARISAASTIVSDIIPSIYDNQEILLPGFLEIFTTIEPNDDNINVLAKLSEIFECEFLTNLLDEDPQTIFETFFPQLLALAENAPNSNNIKNNLINNLAWIIASAIKTEEVECDINQVISAFFNVSIYNEDEIKEMDNSLDSFFINEIADDSDISELCYNEIFAKKSLLGFFNNPIFADSILAFIQENFQSEEIDKRTILYLAQLIDDCNIAEDFYQCYNLAQEDNTFILGNFLLLLSHEKKADDVVIQYLNSENPHMVLYASKAIIELADNYKEYLPLAFIKTAPLIDQIDINRDLFCYFLFQIVKYSAQFGTLSIFASLMDSDLIQSLLNLLEKAKTDQSAFQYICLIIYNLMLIPDFKQVLIENILPYNFTLLDVEHEIQNGLYLLSYMLCSTNTIINSEGKNEIIDEKIIPDDSLSNITAKFNQTMELILSKPPTEVYTFISSCNFEWKNSLMSLFDFMVKNEVYDVISNFFKTIMSVSNNTLYITNCAGILTKLIITKEDAELFDIILNSNEPNFIANIQRTVVYSIFAINPDLCISLMENIKGPTFLQYYAQSCFNDFSNSISLYDFKLFVNMMMHLQIPINLKQVDSSTFEEEMIQMSAQSACIRIIKNLVMKNNGIKMNMKNSDNASLSLSLHPHDVLLSLIPFITIDIHEFITHIINTEQLCEDPEYSQIIQEIQQLLAENMKLPIL